MTQTITTPKPVRKSPQQPPDRTSRKERAPAPSTSAPPCSVEASSGPRQPPPAIANDPQSLELWRNGTEDERFLGEELCALNNRTHATGIECYFRFSDAWFRRFPLEDRNNYKRGEQAVRNGAAMSHTAPSQVYFILKTIKVYPREKYRELARKAAENGLVVTWTHLRTIAERLGKSGLRNIRAKVEKFLVTQKMTEKQLNGLIDDLAPETVPKRAAKDDQDLPAKSQIKSIITSFKKHSSRYRHWLTAITRFEDEFRGDDPREVQAVLEQVRTALDEFQRMAEFIDEGRPLLETLEQQVSFLADHDDQSTRQTTERIARSVQERLAADKSAERQRQQSGRLKLAGDFADDDDDQVPEPALRDDDRFVASSGTVVGDEPVMEEDDFDMEDEKDFDMDEEEDDEWDDPDELDEDGDELFDEMDDLTDED